LDFGAVFVCQLAWQTSKLKAEVSFKGFGGNLVLKPTGYI
jgi:hypothetical protein